MLFSIVTPAYNRSKILPTAIDSVLKQTYPDFELIIVDDGSTDDTHNVVQSYGDPRIKYIYQENKGVCAARNTGIRNASGKYITFLDSDDKVESDWLNDFYQSLQNQTADIVFCDMKVYKIDGTVSIKKAQYRYTKHLNLNGMFMPGTFCIEFSLLNSFGGFDEKLPFGEFTDIDFLLKKKKIVRSFTNKVGLHYYPAEDGGGRNQKNKIEALKYMLKKHKDYFREYRNVRLLYLQNIAISSLRLNYFSQARTYFIRAYLVNPLRLKILLRFLISLFPFLSRKIWKL